MQSLNCFWVDAGVGHNEEGGHNRIYRPLPAVVKAWWVGHAGGEREAVVIIVVTITTVIIHHHHEFTRKRTVEPGPCVQDYLLHARLFMPTTHIITNFIERAHT